jgi:hypothetical protein
MAAFISDEELPQIVKKESSITHMHHLSYQVALAHAVICRALIRGATWEGALDSARSHFTKKDIELQRALNVPKDISLSLLSTSGFAPQVLQAAIHFMNTTSSFSEVHPSVFVV